MIARMKERRSAASKLLERQLLTDMIRGGIFISEENLILDVAYYCLVGKNTLFCLAPRTPGSVPSLCKARSRPRGPSTTGSS